jgi:crotonobetainyl-CoA:carnitine CoA-transferase CaiB-like acyl-CoA transferase
MSEIFAGVRVVEVAGWHMVPAAGAVLADFGADVIKVENPAGGDPQRQVFLDSPAARPQRAAHPLSRFQPQRTCPVPRPDGPAHRALF